jgi:hypothetical protein
MREALRTIELGPLDKSELMRMEKIGEHVHSKKIKIF